MKAGTEAVTEMQNEGEDEVLKMMQLQNQVVSARAFNVIYMDVQMFGLKLIFSV